MSRLVRRFSLSPVRERAGVRARARAAALRVIVTLSMFACCALYPVSYTAAQGSAETTIGFKHGKVMARQLVLGVNGKPIFAEFDTAGEVVSELGEATEENKLQGALVIPGATVRGMVAAFDDLRQRYPDAVVMTRTQYEASRFGLSKDNLLDRPALTSQVKSVLVRVSRIISDVTLVPDQSFVLDTYPLLLPLSGVGSELVTDQTVAVLINNDGVVQRASPHNIGFRAAWISDTTSDVSRDNLATRQIDQKPLGPVTGVLVYGGLYGTMSLTDANGGYSIQYMIPGCPGGSYSIGNKVIAELRTQNFNPRGTYVSSYTVQAPFENHCYGSYAGLAAGPTLGSQSTYSDSQAIMATNSMVEPPLDIKIDVMSLAGQGVLSNDGTLNNAIPVAGETAYATAAVTFNPFNPTFLDLNSDGRADQTFLCGENVKVYFDAPPAEQDPCVAQADVTRLADRPADYTDQGLLTSITESDLEQTDLYVFRVSNGSLISERKGLKPPTTTYQSSGISKNPDGSASNQFFYNMLLRGPRDLGSANPMNTLSFTEWQTRSGIKDPALLERKGDHLRVGEQIKIIAINRVTGYIGSVVTTLQNAAGNQSGALRIGADKIVLRPPNLKIKAERTSIVEAGLTKGEEREYLIGFEGSALKSDKVIALSTEWVDADGSPLPDGLPGYTGRLAKVVDGRRLGGLPPRNDLAEFEVKPGKRVQLIALPDDVAVSNDHFYVHVCAARYSDRTECAAHYTQNRQLSASNPLHYRPKHYVPVRVPLYDEALTQLTKLQLRDNLNNAANEDRKKWLAALRNFDPNYRWPYRPEMQFSVFDLTLRDITKNDITGSTTSMLSSNDATLSASDKLQVSYDLIGQAFESLPRIGVARELVFNLSGAEATATLGVDQQVRFDDLRFLDKLAPEDFITLALLQNDDVANVLWEYVSPKVLLWADYNRNGEIDTDHSDDTTPDKAFVFWVNDDADMVLDQGQIRDDRVECPADTAHATCEEDDVNNLRSGDDGFLQVSNTDDEHKKRIESMRDLEDFIPMQASYWPYVESATMELKAVGVEVNVFRATWQKPRDDVENEGQARRDAENSKDDYLFQLKDGQSAPIPEQYVQQVPAPGGRDVTMGQVNLLVEGTAASTDTCVNPVTPCYVELIVRDGQGHFTNSYKLYLHFKPITRLFEHWTLGDCEGQISGCTLQSQLTRATDQTFDYAHEPGLSELGHREYFLFVHGWRMQPSERRLFARTTFKRLYWQGYKGRFGALTWPTTYFTKPTWLSNAAQVAIALANPQNYDTGESIARRTGKILATQLDTIRGANTDLRVLAHSMGNVVMSEALRHRPSGSAPVAAYVATQAAEAAHSYTPSAPENPDWFTRAGGTGQAFYNGSDLIENWPNAIAAEWQYYLAIPPDRYRYSVGSEHWLEPSLETPPAPHYYSGILGKAGSILNFYNEVDFALEAWSTDQQFKMDSGTTYNRYMTVTDMEAPLEELKRMTVRDEFGRNSQPLVWEGEGQGDILAFITPARSYALGAQGGTAQNADPALPDKHPMVSRPDVSDVATDLNLQKHAVTLTDKSFDHSGQFLSSSAARTCYWSLMVDRAGVETKRNRQCN